MSKSGRAEWSLALAVALSVVLGACSRTDDGLTQRLLESNDKVLACQKEIAQTKSQVTGLKHQLAQAIASPSHVQLTDPEIIELVASLRGPSGGGEGGSVQPTLDPQKASAVVLKGAPAMQVCYERALKKNAALQTRAGIGLQLDVTVRPNGQVQTVDIVPNVDKEMTDCIRTAATRWKFPSFTGGPVTIEQKVTLTPKT
jgi:hypothetical protein